MNKLIMLGLPIGNPLDLSIRATDAIKGGSIFLAEDTRVFKALLKYLGIDFSEKKIISLHDHNSQKKMQLVLELLNENDVYLCSDAGSPYISDPAYPVIKAAIENNVEIETIVGPSSVIAALELSGLPPIPFHFHGFIPRDKGPKEQFLQSLASEYGTHLFFEGVSRVQSTLEILKDLSLSLECSLSREISKKFETTYRFNSNNPPQDLMEKGEFVFVIHNSSKQNRHTDLEQLANDVLNSKGKPKKLAKLLASILGQDVKETYKQLSNEAAKK